jgi:hypothetical protein
MSQHFEYGTGRIKDLSVQTAVDKHGKTEVCDVFLQGRQLKPTNRFWNSLHLRFGFTGNIFRYFTHKEVFDRISKVAANDSFRWCIENNPRVDRLLAVTAPSATMIRHDDLVGLLKDYAAEEIKYSDGFIRSKHAPRCGGTFQVAGDRFQNKFVIDTPIDGYGRPAVYLSLLRLVCSNGAIGFSPAFRSELNVGRGDDGGTFALLRVLEGFNNEDGYAAMRQRFESAATSWASVGEVNRLGKVLTRLHGRGELKGMRPVRGGDGAAEVPPGSPLFNAFHRMTGDLSHIYGLANLEALSAKRQRTLPAACKVYDLLNFVSEIATHHATPAGERVLQAHLGELISAEYDLEGTVEHFDNWQDFFVGSEATAKTVAGLNRRGRR